VCALAPISDLYASRDELVRIGEDQVSWLVGWLVAFANLALFSFAAICIMVARKVTQPLTLITRAVTAVSMGEQQVEVIGALRIDEIGDIARAVCILQHSVAERD